MVSVTMTACGLVIVPAAGAAVTQVAVRHHHRHHHRRHGVRASVARLVPCANAGTPAGSASAAELDAAVVCLVNNVRAMFGLPALLTSSKLDYMAQIYSGYMVKHGVYAHVGFTWRLNDVGYDWQQAGENIDTGPATPAEVVWAWMQSAEHCRNILNPAFRDVGTGVVAAPVAPYGGSATWTQDYGLTMDQSPPSAKTAPQAGCPYTL